jgi:hypothetical protein
MEVISFVLSRRYGPFITHLLVVSLHPHYTYGLQDGTFIYYHQYPHSVYESETEIKRFT